MTMIRQKISRALRKFNDEQLKNFCSLTGLSEFYYSGFKGKHSWHNFGLYVQMACERLPEVDIRRKTQDEINDIMWNLYLNWEKIAGSIKL